MTGLFLLLSEPQQLLAPCATSPPCLLSVCTSHSLRSRFLLICVPARSCSSLRVVGLPHGLSSYLSRYFLFGSVHVPVCYPVLLSVGMFRFDVVFMTYLCHRHLCFPRHSLGLRQKESLSYKHKSTLIYLAFCFLKMDQPILNLCLELKKRLILSPLEWYETSQPEGALFLEFCPVQLQVLMFNEYVWERQPPCVSLLHSHSIWQEKPCLGEPHFN